MFTLLHPQATYEMLGYIPDFLSEHNPDSAAQQLHKNYSHGGGWQPFHGFKVLPDGSIKYPGDPALPPLAMAKLRDEEIWIYSHAWVRVVKADGKSEIARMD